MDKITFRRQHADSIEAQEKAVKEEASQSTLYEIDLMALSRLIVSKRRWVIGVVSVIMIAAAVIMFTTPNRYTSRATILPSGKTNDFSSLKAMVSLGGGFIPSDENSSVLFPLILESDHVKNAVLARRYNFAFESETMDISLSEYFNGDNPDKLRLALASITDVSSDTRTGEITVSVETKYPALSQAIVQEYLNQLEAYNLHKRRSSGKEQQVYLERQLADVVVELEAAEDRLEEFRKINSNWSGTTNPEILTELARLNRDVTIHSTTHMFLQQQYEMANLQAQKDVPIIRILDQPSVPTVKSGPFRMITIALAGMISLVLVIIGVIVLDLVKQTVGGIKS